MGAVCSVEQLPKPLPPTSKQAQSLSELVEKENQHFLQYKSSIPKKPLFGSSELTKLSEKLTESIESTQFHPTPISQQTVSSAFNNVSLSSESLPVTEDEGYHVSQTFHSSANGTETPVEIIEAEYPAQVYQSPLASKRNMEKEDSLGILPIGSDCSSPETFTEHQATIPCELSILTENDTWWSSEDEQHHCSFQEKDQFKTAGPEPASSAISPIMERDQLITML